MEGGRWGATVEGTTPVASMLYAAVLRTARGPAAPQMRSWTWRAHHAREVREGRGIEAERIEVSWGPHGGSPAGGEEVDWLILPDPGEADEEGWEVHDPRTGLILATRTAAALPTAEQAIRASVDMYWKEADRDGEEGGPEAAAFERRARAAAAWWLGPASDRERSLREILRTAMEEAAGAEGVRNATVRLRDGVATVTFEGRAKAGIPRTAPVPPAHGGRLEEVLDAAGLRYTRRGRVRRWSPAVPEEAVEAGRRAVAEARSAWTARELRQQGYMDQSVASERLRAEAVPDLGDPPGRER